MNRIWHLVTLDREGLFTKFSKEGKSLGQGDIMPHCLRPFPFAENLLQSDSLGFYEGRNDIGSTRKRCKENYFLSFQKRSGRERSGYGGRIEATADKNRHRATML